MSVTAHFSADAAHPASRPTHRLTLSSVLTHLSGKLGREEKKKKTAAESSQPESHPGEIQSGHVANRSVVTAPSHPPALFFTYTYGDKHAAFNVTKPIRNQTALTQSKTRRFHFISK